MVVVAVLLGREASGQAGYSSILCRQVGQDSVVGSDAVFQNDGVIAGQGGPQLGPRLVQPPANSVDGSIPFPPLMGGYVPEVYPGQPGPGANPEGGHGFFEVPEERYRGCGDPLRQESWMFRPFSIGAFVGYMQGLSPLVKDWEDQNGGPFGGISVGWDFQYYWGIETRLGWATVQTKDSDRALSGGPNGVGPPFLDWAEHAEGLQLHRLGHELSLLSLG